MKAKRAARVTRPWQLVLLALAGVGGSLVLLWCRDWQLTLNDYATEARHPLSALLHFRVWHFLVTAPPYGASLELRAPFAAIASLADGGAQLVYRFSALPCLLAAVGLAVWIAPQLRSAGRGWIAVLVTLAVCVASPVNYYALSIGHPEEILGGVLCVAAVVAALRGRAALAGVLLGVAIANKQWAVVAVGPVLVALPTGRRRALLWAGGTAVAFLGPIAYAAGSATGAAARVSVSDGGAIFYTQQIWWFLGTPGHWLPSMAGQIQRGFRLEPSWLAGRSHLLIAWIGLPLSYIAARRRMPRENALLLLAMLLLLRCMLDPWDIVYYPIPFILALLAWETTVKHRAPWCAVAASLATWAIFELLPTHLSANQQALSFIVPTVLALALIGVSLYRRQPSSDGLSSAAQSTTSSSFVNWLSRRAPSPVSTARSSIRTPSTPGR